MSILPFECCHKCTTKRTLGCHSTCKEYLDIKEHNEKEKELIDKRKQVDKDLKSLSISRYSVRRDR